MANKLAHLLEAYWGNPTEEDTDELIAFVEYMIKANGIFTTINTATIEDYNIYSAFHTNGTAIDLNDWAVGINRMAVFKNCFNSIVNSGSNVVITFNSNLGYDLIDGDEIEL